MTTRSNFVCETPLTDRDDRVKVLRIVALALVVSIAAILLQVAFVLVASPSSHDLPATPAAADHAAGVFFREVRP